MAKLFLEIRYREFGPYEDHCKGRNFFESQFTFTSNNSGILSPKQIINETIKYLKNNIQLTLAKDS